MSDGFKKLLGITAAACGIYVLSRYMKEYSETENEEDPENESIKTSGAKAREAAKRTYIALKESVNDAAEFVENIVKPDEASDKE